MPNGRTDIFEVEFLQHLAALNASAPSDEIGTLFDAGEEPKLGVTLADLREKVIQQATPRVDIEEHHWDEYILQAGEPVGGWLR